GNVRSVEFQGMPGNRGSEDRHVLGTLKSIMEKPKKNTDERGEHTAPKKEHVPPQKKKRAPRAPRPDRGVAPGITG
ncbi:MAG: hypothetical protein WAR83_14980, partial [Flavobacteriales bacterium]